MNFNIQYTGKENELSLMRRLGYQPSRFNDSFIRLIGRENYPRFHLYLKNNDNDIKFSLHLDQKRASYQAQTAHSGDYDSPEVTVEKQRIINQLKS